MQGLIDGLLTLSKVTSSAQRPVPVSLSQAAKEALSDLEPRIEQAGGQVQIDDLPTIDGDPLQLRLLMQNLISNAVKFRVPGRAPVVRVYNLTEQDNESQSTGLGGEKFCRIAVQDNGIGFDERHADRIFGIFERLQSRAEYDGTGIGLATCRKIAERHGGSITARSQPGLGSTFVVTLPVHRFV
jgi:signal transduction histidine kinase